MTSNRLFAFIAAAAVFMGGSANAFAQGITTGAITGAVTGSGGEPVEGAQVQISNRSNGFTAGGITRSNGVFFVQGLEVGGPYTVSVRRIGLSPARKPERLAERLDRSDFTLTPQATHLAKSVRAENLSLYPPSRSYENDALTRSFSASPPRPAT